MPIISAKDTSQYLFNSIFIGVLLGGIGAAMANLFRHGIVLIADLEIHILGSLPLFYFYFITLAVSAIFVNLVKRNMQNSGFHGVADSIYFAHKSSDCVDIKTGMLSTLAAFISASGGASVGQYGPLVHFGTSFGVLLKRVVRIQLSADLFIGAGVAAAISAGFGAPIAGVLFAHEVILRHYSHTSILAIATAAGVAYAITQYVLGISMVFDFPPYSFDLLSIIAASLFSGPLFGVVAILYMQSLLYFASLSKKIKAPEVYKILIGILLLSCIGSFLPDVMGLGTQTVTNIFGADYGLVMLILILFSKIIATSVSLNFGFFGGVFSPALLVGASAGAIIATILMKLGILPHFEYALVVCGMAAVTGSVIGAPITMLILVIELTGSYVYGLATLVGLAVSVGFTQIRFGASYFDVQLIRRGINIAEGRLGLYLNETPVLGFCHKNFKTIYSSDTVQTAREVMSDQECAELIVISDNNEFIGKIDAISIINEEPTAELEGYVDTNCVRIHDTACLSDAMKIASDFVGEFIPIINKSQNIVVGVISENALFAAYLNEQQKINQMEKQ